MTKNKLMCGKLFIFEGPDGVGKTTISQKVAEYLNTNGKSCKLITFPGREDGTLGKLIYEVHHEPSKYGVNSIASASQQILHIAAHLDTIEHRILPSLAKGCHVVLDRFWWSTWVYGLTSNVSRHVLEKIIDLEKTYWGDVKPAVAILLRTDTPINREVTLQNWRKLSYEYDVLAAKEKIHYPVSILRNDTDLETTFQQVEKVLNHALRSFPPLSDHQDSFEQEQLGLDLDQGDKTSFSSPIFISYILPAKPTVVFDTYWRFAVERQNIFFRKLWGQPQPWTEDPILATFKFTNAYRASDRVSQYLIRHVIYRNDLPSSIEEVFFRIILFKLFNKIETWELLEETVGEIIYGEYSFNQYDQALTHAMEIGQSIYSAAYIMPSGGKAFGYAVKHRNHLKLIEQMLADELPKKLADASSMNRAFQLIRSYPSIGNFLAYQFVTDVNYSKITNFSEMDFVVPGPGALDGIRKCFADLGGLNEPEIIKFMTERQDMEFERLGLKFQSLWGRPLQLIDCQNLFCEVDKYSRVYHPTITGISGRTRIKQKYSATSRLIDYWYPPKWNINQFININCTDSAKTTGTQKRTLKPT
jgi:thymidylate kinase